MANKSDLIGKKGETKVIAALSGNIIAHFIPLKIISVLQSRLMVDYESKEFSILGIGIHRAFMKITLI